MLQADRLGIDYGLRLPALELAPDTGAAHRQRCLEAGMDDYLAKPLEAARLHELVRAWGGRRA